MNLLFDFGLSGGCKAPLNSIRIHFLDTDGWVDQFINRLEHYYYYYTVTFYCFFIVIVLYFLRWLSYCIFIGNQVIIEKTELDDDGGCV